ncbi:acyltransferase [Gigaspora margarita]|uniref:Acyltransferase n=1 Tax=Gigaspora margarita TaxID=4874 RepID=A0A8H4ESA1_GIGMA|nr:acyltransferase [Gigaspora margarita]
MSTHSDFHFKFLDGIRGAAALSVVFSHSQTLYKQVLPFTTFTMIGFDAVHCFFVLSAFLLTFRALMDWEQYYENWIEQNFVEKGMLYDRILDDDELNTVTNNKKDSSLFKFLDHTAIKYWLKYFFRRIMRVYPTYAIVLLSIVYIDPIGKAYYNAIKTSNLLQHLTLQSAEYIFWSIPPEMMYYLFIPIIVIGYVGITHMGIFLSNKLYCGPKIGAWTGRVLGNIIIFGVRTLIALYHDPGDSLQLSGSAHYFLSGSICAIWYREIVRLGLFPLSLEEEKALVKKKQYISNESSGVCSYIINNLPSRHWVIRHFFDGICYFIFFIILCTMPHLSSKVLGLPKNLILELYTGGFLYAFLILAGLLSRNSSFVNACSWNLFCFSGKISFSIYLLHPVGLTIVNNYATSIGVRGAANETEDDEKVNDVLDAVMLAFVVTVVLSWCFHKVIERPIMNFTNYVTKSKFFEHKKIDKHYNLHTA